LLAAAHQLVEPSHWVLLTAAVGQQNYGIKTPNPASPKAYRIWHAPA
jgi:hypothetical protein